MRPPIGYLRRAPRLALLVLLVQLPRHLRRPALVGQRLDRDRPLELPDPDREPVAHGELFRRLYPLPADLHFATHDSGLGKAAGLIEARRPEPLVYSH